MKKLLILIMALGLLSGCKSDLGAAPASVAPADEAPAAEAPADEAPAAEAPADEAAAGEAPAADAAAGEAAHADTAAGAHGHDHGDAVACTCDAGKGGGTVWCEACSTGYINGEKNADKDAVMAAMAAK